jgi:hypothetical protein
MINHILFWINFNKRMKVNSHDGITWMYQTIDEMCAHFPYLSYDQLQRLLSKLVAKGIIVKGNFNKWKSDRTNWYTIKEELLTAPLSGMTRNRVSIEDAKSRQPSRENASALPDTKDRYLKEDNIVGAVAPVVSADAERLYTKFLKKLNEINTKRKPLTEKEKETWIKTIDLMIRVDKRSIEDIEALIDWFPTHSFWSQPIQSPTSLRKHFDKMFSQMRPPVTNEQENRKFVQEIMERYSNEFRGFKITKSYVTNPTNTKEVYFANHPPAKFRELFLDMADMEMA